MKPLVTEHLTNSYTRRRDPGQIGHTLTTVKPLLVERLQASSRQSETDAQQQAINETVHTEGFQYSTRTDSPYAVEIHHNSIEDMSSGMNSEIQCDILHLRTTFAFLYNKAVRMQRNMEDLKNFYSPHLMPNVNGGADMQGMEENLNQTEHLYNLPILIEATFQELWGQFQLLSLNVAKTLDWEDSGNEKKDLRVQLVKCKAENLQLRKEISYWNQRLNVIVSNFSQTLEELKEIGNSKDITIPLVSLDSENSDDTPTSSESGRNLADAVNETAGGVAAEAEQVQDCNNHGASSVQVIG
ncbi:unnamed protein product [Soboliphyme baturini]|uniref:Protein ECM11 n=1 Tax=Soboliphyme baturini TaxID=241478 RepID=A0A183IZ44_9BILA|nr:unnamed protein product [Soboliphyme baturini]